MANDSDDPELVLSAVDEDVLASEDELLLDSLYDLPHSISSELSVETRIAVEEMLCQAVNDGEGGFEEGGFEEGGVEDDYGIHVTESYEFFDVEEMAGKTGALSVANLTE